MNNLHGNDDLLWCSIEPRINSYFLIFKQSKQNSAKASDYEESRHKHTSLKELYCRAQRNQYRRHEGLVVDIFLGAHCSPELHYHHNSHGYIALCIFRPSAENLLFFSKTDTRPALV